MFADIESEVIYGTDLVSMIRAEAKEAYCSTKVAKLLEEKGFDEPCVRFVYQLKDRVKYGMDKDCPTNTDLKPIYTSVWSVPTHQMAMAWLRKMGIAIVPIISGILDNENFLWDIEIVIAKTNETYSQGWVYEQYESAIDNGLEYVLENLI